MISTITLLDQAVLLWIQEYIRNGVLTPLMVIITTLGDNGYIWILLSSLLMIPKKFRRTGIVCLCALALSFVINNLILKNLIARTRPFLAVPQLANLVAAEEYSFPSGHSSSSFACGYVMFRRLPKYMGVPALILAVLIAVSRLYVGVHYPTDVLAGALSGSLVAALCCRLSVYLD